MGDPLGTAGHTRTGNPRLSGQGRSLEPRDRNRIRNLNQNTSLKAAQPTRNLQPDPKLTGAQAVHRDIWTWRICAPVQGLGLQTWERQQQDLWKEISHNPLSADHQCDRRSESIWHMTVLSLKGCEGTVLLFPDENLTFAGLTLQKEKYHNANPDGAQRSSCWI